MGPSHSAEIGPQNLDLDMQCVRCSNQRWLLQGWRFIWFCVAGVAAIAMVAVFTGGIEPRNLKPKEVDPGRGRAGHQKPTFWQAAYKGIVVILSSTKTVFRIRSFQIILLAGTVGSVAVMGMGYKIMYFQVRSFALDTRTFLHMRKDRAW